MEIKFECIKEKNTNINKTKNVCMHAQKHDKKKKKKKERKEKKRKKKEKRKERKGKEKEKKRKCNSRIFMCCACII